ncbi:MAG: acetyltransferase, partial [Muribaculaceae bacterium]|nr:acetyltransferase [Muribaculaceae bacterium]
MSKYRLYRLLLDMVAVWPLKMLYPLSDMVSFILHKVAKYRVPVVRKNLAMAFPKKSEAELKQIEDDFYRHFCDIFVETAKLSNMSERELDRRIGIEGVEHINAASAQG